MISLTKQITIVLLTLLVVGNVGAAKETDGPLFLRQNQAGLRLGAWSSQGDSPPDSGIVTIDESTEYGSFTTNIKNSSFYLELFYAYRISDRLMLEIAGGTSNRGSVSITNGSSSDIGNLTLYPITIQARLYPFTAPLLGIYPYVSGGGGLYFGRRTVQFTDSGSSYSNWAEESGTDLNYAIGGGLDWPLASNFGLDLAVKYMPVNFSKLLLTVEDYQAFTITIGLKYIYLK